MAKFSRAHYIILANALLRAKVKLLEAEPEPGYSNLPFDGLTAAIEEITSALEGDNRAFDRERFMEWIKEGDSWRGHA